MSHVSLSSPVSLPHVSLTSCLFHSHVSAFFHLCLNVTCHLLSHWHISASHFLWLDVTRQLVISCLTVTFQLVISSVMMSHVSTSSPVCNISVCLFSMTCPLITHLSNLPFELFVLADHALVSFLFFPTDQGVSQSPHLLTITLWLFSQLHHLQQTHSVRNWTHGCFYSCVSGRDATRNWTQWVFLQLCESDLVRNWTPWVLLQLCESDLIKNWTPWVLLQQQQQKTQLLQQIFYRCTGEM